MSVVRSFGRGLGTIIAAVAGFVAGSIGWAAVSGAIGAALDSVGIVLPASTYLALSPAAGAVAAYYLASEVRG